MHLREVPGSTARHGKPESWGEKQNQDSRLESCWRHGRWDVPWHMEVSCGYELDSEHGIPRNPDRIQGHDVHIQRWYARKAARNRVATPRSRLVGWCNPILQWPIQIASSSLEDLFCLPPSSVALCRRRRSQRRLRSCLPLVRRLPQRLADTRWFRLLPPLAPLSSSPQISAL